MSVLCVAMRGVLHTAFGDVRGVVCVAFRGEEGRIVCRVWYVGCASTARWGRCAEFVLLRSVVLIADVGR